ncbi:MAG: SIR2 family protein [Proteobacteria bacterium]|nr:SIR2 family protein [Pseudomonadota bacterium]
MLDEIPKKLDTPDSLRIAASQKNLVPFIGAGVSKLAGYPNWDEFANAALMFFVKHEKFSHAQFDQISKLPSRVKLSLAVDLEKRHELTIQFEEILQPTQDKKPLGDEVYGNLLKLSQFSETFLTTNYDKELDEISPAILSTYEKDKSIIETIEPPCPIYKLSEINVSSLAVPNAVIHVHGSVQNRDSLVLTTSDYLERYYGHRVEGQDVIENPFLTFLRELFESGNVIFIGYGLNELEVLEYVIQKGIEKPSSNATVVREAARHYVIQGFFSHELELARSLESYFLSFGIKLLPFSLDEHG